MVLEPTSSSAESSNAVCEVQLESINGLSLWSEESLFDQCSFSIELFEGMLLPLCSDIIQEPVVGVNDPLIPVASLGSQGTFPLATSSFGSTELTLFIDIFNAGDV